ncbi:MAG: hypothetical protein H0X34_04025 [Chthoniobacterales bacterium]|nr:hypothetical protein [Chthoniobacterales bacterium]
MMRTLLCLVSALMEHLLNAGSLVVCAVRIYAIAVDFCGVGSKFRHRIPRRPECMGWRAVPNDKETGDIMKRLLCVGILVLAGCANNNPRLTDQPQLNADGSRSYSHEVLNKTGRQTPAEALAQDDPSVTVSHR